MSKFGPLQRLTLLACAIAWGQLHANPPNALALSANGGGPVNVATPFIVVVNARHEYGSAPVSQATTIELKLSSGTGTLTGPGGCVIPAGETLCVIESLVYSKPRESIGLEASVSSGDALPPVVQSVYVDAYPAHLSIAAAPTAYYGESTTFSAILWGLDPTGTVEFRREADTVACPAASLVGSGDHKVAYCTLSDLPIGEHRLSARYAGDERNMPASTVAGFVHTVEPVTRNVALASNGSTASASSTISIQGSDFGVAAINDGMHFGTWGRGGGWNDGTGGTFPDWVQIQFDGPKSIDRVVVTTLQDDFDSPVEPIDGTTFSKYGVTAFDVQTWNGKKWTVQASVTGNDRVKRSVNIPVTTTDRIRVVARNALASYSRIMEVEAWTVASKSATRTSLEIAPNPLIVGSAGTAVMTATVDGNAPTGDVQMLEGQSIACSAPVVAGTAECRLGLAPGSYTFTALYLGDGRNLRSTSDPVELFVGEAAPSVNVASLAQGAVATASSTYAANGSRYDVRALQDGDLMGRGWGVGTGGGWNDATGNQFPDWVQVAFSGAKTIDRVVVVTLQDDFEVADPPVDSTTFTKWGVTSFTVQTWNGASWVTQASIAGNSRVKRTVTFPPVTTDRIRVVVNGALASYSRLVEIEAWTSGDVPTTTTLTTSANPATPGATITFTATVLNATTGTVAFCGATGTPGMCPYADVVDGRASYSTTLPLGSFNVQAHFGGSPGVQRSSSVILVQRVTEQLPSMNVALASNGGVASASSTISIQGADFGVAAVNDGSHRGIWGSGGGWNDGTGGSFPDWVQIRFAGPRTIDKVVLTTLQDDFAAPLEPVEGMKFSQYGITAFQVQTWTGSAWATKATVPYSDQVKAVVAIPATSTERIRIVINKALASYSRVVEIEAWTANVAAKAMEASYSEPTVLGPPSATVKADGDAAPIPALSPAVLALLAFLVGLAGAAARRRRRPPP